MAVPVGLNVWSRLVEDTFPYLDQTVAPFDSLWFPDHVQYGANKVAEGWSLLAWALARYPDKLCGHEVLCNSFRNPALLAKMAATAQALSGGRVVLGIGAGWNEEEYRAYGWPYPPAPVRIAQLAEAIELIRLMWAGGPATYTGEHYRIAGAYCEPRPRPVPPIMVGGHGEKYLLRVVARHADWWNYVYKGRDALRPQAGGAQGPLPRRRPRLRRDPPGPPRRYPDRRVRARAGAAEGSAPVRPHRGRTARGHPRPGHRGHPRAIAQGAHRLTVHFADSPRPEGTWLFAATVLPTCSPGR